MFDTLYQEFIYKRTYSRWLDSENRRENWDETVDRYKDFFIERVPEGHINEFLEAIEYIRHIKIMPSMRSLWTAGKALERENICGYNCSYITIDNIKAFSEILYILMCGTGAGFSVERQYIANLPEIPNKFKDSKSIIIFADSKLGWAEGYYKILKELYKGNIPKYDLSKIRHVGARLKIFGGRASGPDPLEKLIKFTINMITHNNGRRLSSINCHDLCCMIANIVVVGGVRRCLPYNTHIITNKGMEKICNIKKGDVIVTGGEEFKVLNSINTGIQNTINITHDFGYINCTMNHRVAVFDDKNYNKYDFKFAKDIKVGDCIVWDSIGYEGITTYLPTIKNERKDSKSVKVNTPKLTTDIAWLIGVIHGDGSISKATVEITIADYDKPLLYKIQKIITNFGLHGTISEGHGACKRVRINSTNLVDWFNEYIKKNNTDITIPEFIMKGTKDIRGAYLAGLFDTDGRSRKDGVCEQISTIYKSLNDDTIIILSSLGIGCQPFKVLKKLQKNDCYTINIKGITNRVLWLKLIGKYCISKKLIDVRAKLGNSTDFKYKSSMFNYPIGWKKDGYITVQTAIKKGFIKDIPVYCPTVVKNIKNGKETDTYDIEIDIAKRFTAEGIIVHNSACISYSNLSDDRMAKAKSGSFWLENPQRTLSNNSVAYTEKPDSRKFLSEWIKLIESRTGERGIFNRGSAKLLVARSGRRDINYEFGGNPCLEINLRPNEFCNLSEVVIRKNDTKEDLKRKVRYATIIGCLQSTLTNFKFLSRTWKQNCEEERLLGVSLTGIMDHPILNNINKKMKVWLHEMKEEAIQTAEEWSGYLDINMPTAITCIKPSGNVSQLTNTSSGIHTRFSSNYIRRVRVSSLDPIANFLINKGVPVFPETGFTINNTSNYIFEFPIQSPKTSRMRDEMTILQQLEIYKVYMQYWIEHNISSTIYVRDNEWPEVAAWVYKNWNTIVGLSFLPYDTGIYELAPYEEISEEEYDELESSFPKDINFEDLNKFEKEDTTKGAQILACTGDNCEL